MIISRHSCFGFSKIQPVLAVALFASAPAWSAHPLLTDDTGTQGTGGFQLEIQTESSKHEATVAGVRVKDTAQTSNVVLAYGITDTLDVALAPGWISQKQRVDSDPEDKLSGQGDTAVELKWRFFEKDGYSLALKPGIYLDTADTGLGNGKTSYGVALIGTAEMDAWTALWNIGYTRNNYEDPTGLRKGLWQVSLGAAVPMSDTLQAVAEVGTRTNDAIDDAYFPDKMARFASLGAIWSPADNMDFDVGVRKGLNDAEDDTVVLLGATFRW